MRPRIVASHAKKKQFVPSHRQAIDALAPCALQLHLRIQRGHLSFGTIVFVDLIRLGSPMNGRLRLHSKNIGLIFVLVLVGHWAS